MLETIREYGQEVLGQSRDSFEDRHAQFMAELAQQALDSPDPAEAARLLAPERDNLRAAIAWATETGDPVALLLATSYAALCAFEGPLGEGRLHLQNALDTGSAETSALRARALRAAASFAERQGDLGEARMLGEAALEMARETSDALQAGRALACGIVTADEGDYERSEALQREGLAIFQEYGSVRDVHQTLGMLGALMIMRGDYAGAHSLLEGALDAALQSGDTHGVLVTAANLGAVLARQGRHAEVLEVSAGGLAPPT